ncbi:TPA: hypothetical protein ACNUVO_004009 [Aeromonas salmonicida subsp. pectinolytica]
MLGQDLANQRSRKGLPLLTLALALLAFSHLPSLLLMMGLITLRALLQAWRSRILFPIQLVAMAQVLGLVMAAILLLPALLD